MLMSPFTCTVITEFSSSATVIYIDASHTDAPDEFMTSVSAHGGLLTTCCHELKG